MAFDHIPNESLTIDRVPDEDADWYEIAAFALTFSGYRELGSFKAVADVANRHNPTTLTEYRTCLFFEQRRWRHFAEDPDSESLTYIRGLVAGIRNLVRECAS